MTESRDDWAGLLQAANRGDGVAYAAFLQKAAPVIRGIVRARAGGLDPHTREDIVQETLLAIHLKRQSWVEGSPVRPWLYAITRHKIVDALRRNGRDAVVAVDELAETTAAEAKSDPFEASDVERLLARLDERSGQILRALAFESAGLAEIGPRFSLSAGAARVALHRALAKLAALRRGDGI
jgi:RNA polymerase sigma factor (sigma-70 family)